MKMRMLACAAAAMAILVAMPLTAHAVTYVWEGTQKGENSGDPAGWRDHTIFIGDDMGRAIFFGDEDEIFLLDWLNDGMRIGAEWKITSGSDAGRWGLCYNVRGSGGSWGPSYVKCNKAFHAGDVIMRLGRCDGTVNPCGQPGSGGQGWQDWTAWFEGHNDAYNRVAN